MHLIRFILIRCILMRCILIRCINDDATRMQRGCNEDQDAMRIKVQDTMRIKMQWGSRSHGPNSSTSVLVVLLLLKISPPQEFLVKQVPTLLTVLTVWTDELERYCDRYINSGNGHIYNIKCGSCTAFPPCKMMIVTMLVMFTTHRYRWTGYNCSSSSVLGFYQDTGQFNNET